MAIGDNNNSNLFGTNYNPEDEERKKAELAAQNARMGAGNVPASAFGQAPAVAPFSMEAAGQVNPMMEEQSIPTESVSNLITNNPFLATNETPVAAQPPVKNALLEMLERADAREAQGLPRQAAPGIIDAPAETPSVDAQEQSGTVVSPFLQSPNTPSGLGGPLLRGFDMVNDAARGPNAPMGQDATRAALGGMTLNEYLNAPAGTPGVSGLRTDPQGRMISSPAPAVANNFSPQASGGQVGPAKVSDEIMSQVARPAGQTAEFRDGNRDGIEDREQGIFRPGELIGYDAQGNEVRSPGTQQPVNRIPASSQPPVAALSSFEQDSLARQQRIGGTGSFEGDSAAREARLKANERQPGESQTERDTRVAQSRTTGSQAGGMSFDDARRRAEGQLAARGVKNPSVSMVNDLARAIQTQGPAALTPSEQLAREQFEFDKQQALIGDDTADNATTRKIATIKQANPNISDADAAAIASGSVKVVSNPITGETQLLNIATGVSKQIAGQSSSDVDFDVAVPEQTLFSRAGDFTGFVEATKRKAQGITGQVGLDVATEESLRAAQDFETAQNELVRAFRESSRYAASEAAALKKELNISLSPFEDPKSAEAKLRSIDKSLARRYENEVATFRDTTFPPSDRQDARMRAKAIAEFRANLGVPPESQGSTSSTQENVPSDVDPKEWEFMSTEERNLFN